MVTAIMKLFLFETDG